MFGEKPRELPQLFAFVLIPQFSMMPLAAAVEPLRIANRMSERDLYKWTSHSVDGEPVVGSNGMPVMVDGS
ncbi:MAG: GlxA family transcriptional regulator, partial [Pseudomonadota bacterium]